MRGTHARRDAASGAFIVGAKPAEHLRDLPWRAGGGAAAHALAATGARDAQSASNSDNAPSIAAVSAGFIGAMWPQTDFTTRHSPFGICLASYSASTGGK